jgi:RNA polymerase sigma factor (sigma-70 family)
VAALSQSELPHAGRGAALAWRLASDDAIVRGVARHQDAAFAALYDRYHAPLERYCRSMLLDLDDAQDAAQSALASALRALRSERTLPLRLRPWLYRIAHNEALAVMRRRTAAPVGGLDEQAAELAAPDDSDTREAFRELLGDLRTLPARQRSALVLRELEGLSYAEVAGALELSQDAARAAVFEARAALHAQRDGRASSCIDVQRRLSVGDGRTARSRALRAHLGSCEACSAVAAQIRGRRRALRAIFPLPGIMAVGSGSGWALAGFGTAGVATKCAALCATVALLGGSVAALETTHHAHPRHGPASATAVATPQPHHRQLARQPRAATALVLTARHAPSAARGRVAHARAVPRRAHVPRQVQRHAGVTQAHLPAPPPASTTSTTTAPPAPAPQTTTTATASQQAAVPAPAAAAAITAPVTSAIATAKQTVKATLSVVQQTTQAMLDKAQQALAQIRDRVTAALDGRAGKSANAPTS